MHKVGNKEERGGEGSFAHEHTPHSSNVLFQAYKPLCQNLELLWF